MSAAIHWSGPVLVTGAVALGLAIVLIASRPVVGQALTSEVAGLLALWTADA